MVGQFSAGKVGQFSEGIENMRLVSIDTCKAIEIEGLSNWYSDNTGKAALSYVNKNRSDLLIRNGFYSNQLLKLKYYQNSNVTSVFKDRANGIGTEEIELDDLREEFKYLKTKYFDVVKEKYGDFKIFGDYSEVNDSIFRVFIFHLVFEKYVSMEKLIEFSSQQSIQTVDKIINVPLAVEETFESAQVRCQGNGIHISELEGKNNISIYNLLGSRLFEKQIDFESDIFIPLNEISSKIIFVKVNNKVFKIATFNQ